ncbi:TolC family protein [Sphingobacterium psychroaquaticum]|uniref:Outer membrane protein TolC n=1 Tax=Sphingobacterium psychroaquaticum TaxID=561061 RepID=A0A1X7IK50_9SPHI|nr:TolC family protein [Sphingobacterium psychroaquaticum]SMG15106.1 Outer membrane protein TolC [Sphingobacterium psychroaquaticum]
MRKKWFWFLYLSFGVVAHQSVVAQTGIAPQVKGAIKQSFQASRELKIKSLEVDKTVLEADGVRAKKLPHVDATGLYGFVYTNGSLDIPTLTIPILNVGLFEGASAFTMRTQAAYAGVSVKQVLFSGLQIPNGEKALQEKSKAQALLMESGKEGMAKELIAAFDQLMLLGEVDKLIADSEKRLSKEQEKVNKAIMNGLAIPYDRDKLKLALLELEAKKVEVEGNRDLLVKKIRQETALSEEEVREVQYELVAILLAEVPTDVQDRKELQALQASSRAYDYLYKKEKGAALPMLFAFGSANYLNVFDTHLSLKNRPLVGDVDLSNNHLKGRPNLMVGIGAKWDIFNGGEHKSKVKQVQADQAINTLKLQDTEEKLNLLLEKNKVGYAVSNQKLHVGEQQIKVAENNLRLASKQYQAGLIDVTELLAAENDWYKVNLGYYGHVMEQRLTAIELLHGTGKLLQTIYE